LQDLGIGHGDTVAFLMANCPEYIFCEYALAKRGAIRVPLAVLLAPGDHIYMMNEAQCATLIYHRDMQDRVLAMAAELQTVTSFIRVGGEDALPDGHTSLESLIESDGPDPDPVEIDPEDLAGIYFTGGTTGRPKGVMLSHRSWIYTYYSEMLELEIAWGEVFLFPTPLTHAGGCLLLPIFLRCGRCVIVDHFEPEDFMATIERERVSATFLVPTMIYVLLDHPARASFDLSSIENIVYGAAPIAPERLKQALEAFGPVMTQLFGQTEAPMMMSVLSRFEHVVDDPERETRILGSAGRPTYQTRLRLLDDDGADAEAGAAGEIVVQCANVMSGYLNNPDATAATIRDGWLYTGDVGEIDKDGYLTIVDRKKDMVISGGFNIYPREIEDVLHEHPAVQGVAVVGAPHEKWGEVVVAVVALRDGAQADESELIRYVKERKGSLVAPKIVLLWDEIPLTNLGKLDKKVIREQVSQVVE
jgi:acyl-CoA synthetase (AMP-forming)/AMP-acid ligase II